MLRERSVKRINIPEAIRTSLGMMTSWNWSHQTLKHYCDVCTWTWACGASKTRVCRYRVPVKNRSFHVKTQNIRSASSCVTTRWRQRLTEAMEWRWYEEYWVDIALFTNRTWLSCVEWKALYRPNTPHTVTLALWHIYYIHVLCTTVIPQ